MNQSDILAVNELKMLSIDIINKAGSGHPGACMDMSCVMYTLFARVLNVYPKNPEFYNHDRVILSSSFAPLYYAMLYMAGFPITKEDLMNFKRCGSNTPSLLEYNNPPMVDASSSYAGDNVATSVGLSLGRRYYDALFKKEDKKLELCNFTTYCFLTDADFMSGTSLEAFSFAGAQKLSHLVFLYDANNMGEEGSLEDVLNEDVERKMNALGFYVDTIKDTSNIKEITRTLEAAKNIDKPALIIFKNVIGKDSFNAGKNILHYGVLSIDDTAALRRKYNLFLPQFEISKDSILHIETQINSRMEKIQKKWNDSYSRLKDINSANLNHILNTLQNRKSDVTFTSSTYKINDGYRESMLESNFKIMNLIASKNNLFLGGSASSYLSSRSFIDGSSYQNKENPIARNIRFGARERCMAYALNGMSLLGLKVYASSRLIYADEMKSAIRMSAMMNIPTTYLFTHDSLYYSEEGSARIPVEQLSMLRSIPNLYNYRPADIIELMGCWECILKLQKPNTLLITKNSIPKLPGTNASLVEKGGYIIRKETTHCDGIIIATGSEVISALQIAFDFARNGLDIRVVSMPCVELFQSMGSAYQEEILPKNVKTIVIEASNSKVWYSYATSEDYIIHIDDYSYGGLQLEVLQKMNFDYDSLKLKIESLFR